MLLGGMSMYWMTFGEKDSRLRPFTIRNAVCVTGSNHAQTNTFDYTFKWTWMIDRSIIAWSRIGIITIYIEHVVKEHLFISRDINRWGKSGFQVGSVLNSTALQSNWGLLISVLGWLSIHKFLVFPLSQLQNTININKSLLGNYKEISKLRILQHGLWFVVCGLWIVDCGLWIVDCRL